MINRLRFAKPVLQVETLFRPTLNPKPEIRSPEPLKPTIHAGGGRQEELSLSPQGGVREAPKDTGLLLGGPGDLVSR